MVDAYAGGRPIYEGAEGCADDMHAALPARCGLCGAVPAREGWMPYRGLRFCHYVWGQGNELTCLEQTMLKQSTP